MSAPTDKVRRSSNIISRMRGTSSAIINRYTQVYNNLAPPDISYDEVVECIIDPNLRQICRNFDNYFGTRYTQRRHVSVPVLDWVITLGTNGYLIFPSNDEYIDTALIRFKDEAGVIAYCHKLCELDAYRIAVYRIISELRDRCSTLKQVRFYFPGILTLLDDKALVAELTPCVPPRKLIDLPPHFNELSHAVSSWLGAVALMPLVEPCTPNVIISIESRPPVQITPNWSF